MEFLVASGLFLEFVDLVFHSVVSPRIATLNKYVYSKYLGIIPRYIVDFVDFQKDFQGLMFQG